MTFKYPKKDKIFKDKKFFTFIQKILQQTERIKSMTDKKRKTPASNYSSEVYAKMKKYQKKYGFEIGTGKHDAWNNEADAFKHTFAAVETALRYNAGLTKLAGDYHERQGRREMGQTQGEENMDKWNNAEGRKIAQKIAKQAKSLAQLKLDVWNGKYDDLIAEEVMKKMRKGDLITHPNDNRKYKDTKSASQKVAHNILHTFDEAKTASQKFDEEIRAKYQKMKNSRLQRFLGKSKSSKSTGSGNGHWVTINGAHVYLE